MAIFRGVGGSGDSSDNSFLDEVTAQAQSAEASATAAANSATSALNTELTSASFNTSNGVLTLTKQDGDTVTTDLDGRFLLTESNDLSSSVTWANVPNANITQSSVTQHQAALSITESQISDLQSYLTSYTETDPVFSAHAASNVTTTKITNWDSAYNDKITAVNYSDSTSTLTLTQQDGGILTTTINASGGGGGTATGVDLADNVRASFGADDDLEIFHQSSNSNSIIKESGGGILSLQTNGSEIGFFDTANNQHIAWFKTGAECSLRYDGDEKFKTTSTGIYVTGGMTTTGNVGIGTSNPDDVGSSRTLHINDNTHGGAIRLSEGGTNNAFISYDHPTGMRIQSIDTIALKTANTERMRIANNGDISFYEDTGTTPKFFWDASAERLGIGTSNPASNLHIYSQTEAKVTIQGDSDNDAGEEAALLEFKTDGNAVAHTIGIKQGTSNDLVIDSGNGSLSTVATGVVFKTKPTGTTTTAERMRIDTSGNLLVGTTDNSPVGNNDSDGIALLANGSGQFSRDNGTALLVNRKTSDGELLRFNKDSAPVGSIGVSSSDNLTVGSSASGHAGFELGEQYLPLIGGGASDGSLI